MSGVGTGEVAGACYARAAFSFARAPGTNAYLLVVDDISIGTPPGEKAGAAGKRKRAESDEARAASA